MISIQYAAGFFDGEGTVTASARCSVWERGKTTPRRTAYFLLAMLMNNTCRDVLVAFQSRWGGTVSPLRYRDPRRKPCWIWRTTGSNAAIFVKAVIPYLLVKREVAACGLALQQLPTFKGKGRWMGDTEMDAVYHQRLLLVAKIRKLNQRGTLPQREYDYKRSGIKWSEISEMEAAALLHATDRGSLALPLRV